MTSLTSHLLFLDTNALTFDSKATIPDNFKVLGHVDNTPTQNIFAEYDSLATITAQTQNFTNFYTIEVNQTFSIPAMSTDTFYTYYLALSGTSPSIVVFIYQYQNFVGLVTNIPLGVYTDILGFVNYLGKLYFWYFASSNFYFEVIDETNIALGSWIYSIPFSAVSASMKFYSDVMVVCIQPSTFIFNNITTSYTEIERLEFGQGAFADLTGTIIDFIIMDNILIFTTDLMVIYKYDLASKQLLDDAPVPALLL